MALTSAVVVPLVVFIGIFFWQLPTDQEAFDEANTIYRSGDWMAAGQAFDKFLAWRDESPFAGEARIKLDLAGIGWWRPATGLALYAALLPTHGWITGVPLLGM